MGKKKAKSETFVTTAAKPTSSSVTELVTMEAPKELPKNESPNPAPQFTGPTITLKDIDVKSGGIISVTCLDDKVPLGKIQIIEIKAGNSRYIYRRI